MENATSNSSFMNSMKEYGKLRLEIYTLKFTARVSEMFSGFIAAVILFLVVGTCILFASFSAAYYIGQQMNNVSLGFLIVAGFYLFLVILVLLFKNRLIKRPVENSVINHILNS